MTIKKDKYRIRNWEQYNKSLVYPSRVKTWEFPKVSARSLVPSKQPPIQEIGEDSRGD